jgi:glycerophosphoryl diester phosphodiesterase
MRGFLWLAICAGCVAQSVSIVAHRGAKNLAPENTIAAFEAAAALGADYMEVDVRPTRDKRLILMHDATVDRTTNGHGAVAALTFEEIRRLDAGGGQKIPSFREALLWAKKRGVRIDVDHKAGTVQQIADEIRETGMIESVVIEGKLENLLEFSKRLPGVDTMPKVASVGEIQRVCQELRTTVVRLSIVQLEDPAAVKAVRACGARVSVTILGLNDHEEQMKRVIGLGAQLIETDRPDLLARLR